MTIKTWIARKLSPETFKDAQRYDRMRRVVELDRQWLAHDFPAIGAFAERLLADDRNHWRSLDDEYVKSRWHWDISQFREQLRRGEHRPPPPSPQKER